MRGEAIGAVLARLDAIARSARREGSRLGYFAAVYRRVTAEVARALPEFDDPERMERLDVAFAQRYLDAYDAFRSGRPTTRAWQLAFGAAQRPDLIALQHLVAGINAHINLDLGIAAARVAPGHELPALRADFDRINALLAALLPVVERQLGAISPQLGKLDAAFGSLDTAVGNFSLLAAREFAWTVALSLAWTPPALQELQIRSYDRTAAHLGRAVLDPPLPLSALLAEIRAAESTSVSAVLDALGD